MTHKVLILGAGFVAGPAVEYLTRDNRNQVTLVSHIKAEAEAIASNNANVTPLEGDVTNESEMNALIKDHDLVISLVPYTFHVLIARLCIANKIPMVTASYVSDEMKSLNEKAKNSDVLILNEIGLDPGIDHLSAMKIIDEAHDKGGQVISFASWCGGLPAPECNDNPLGYKFAWAPRAVLLALLNQARYLKGGNDEIISDNQLLASAQPVDVSSDFELEGYPNRDSTGYREAYGIPEVQNLIRGTLRYKGFCGIFDQARALGLLDINATVPKGVTWKQWFEGRKSEINLELSPDAEQALNWLGLNEFAELPEVASMLDAFCSLLQNKLQYADNEYDMIALQHKFEIQFGDVSEYLSSTLIVKGEANGFSAMAKTVGYPAAIAAQLILNGEISGAGVKIPVEREIYEPILDELEQEGIVCIEKEEQSLTEQFF